MKTRNTLAAFILVALAAWTVQAQNAAKPKVGDWVQWKNTSSIMDKEFTVTVKQSVKAVDEKNVTVEFETTFGDKAFPGKEVQIPLDQFSDPLKAMQIGKGKAKGKVEKLESGKANVDAAGKKYATEWTSYKVSDFGGKDMEATVKIWISQDVPLNGMVRMEMNFGAGKSTMELTGYGRAK